MQTGTTMANGQGDSLERKIRRLSHCGQGIIRIIGDMNPDLVSADDFRVFQALQKLVRETLPGVEIMTLDEFESKRQRQGVGHGLRN